VRIGLAGPDVVRDAAGDLVVLEDNTRTPTLQAYALAARRAVHRVLGGIGPQPRPIHTALVDLLNGMARAAVPEADGLPVVAILGKDPGNYVLWELEELGRTMGWPVVAVDELELCGDRVFLPDGRMVDLLWRRTSAELLSDIGAPLRRALEAGSVRILNAFGCAAADDKRTYPYVEDLIRFFCGEEPIIRSVTSYDLGTEEHRAVALDRLDELVLKPRGGCGGFGVTLGPHATRSRLEQVRDAVDADPSGWVAQELVALSTHPTVVDGMLEPRHVDLRPAVVASPGGRYRVLPGGLSRFAPEAGDLVVNCSQGGGGKDVWVLDH
jgi:carboxylate-amine ligase